ncbi:hypothetical protein T439DRAFT_334812 [Meredithblackwellia eburnea MCA 4105]
MRGSAPLRASRASHWGGDVFLGKPVAVVGLFGIPSRIRPSACLVLYNTATQDCFENQESSSTSLRLIRSPCLFSRAVARRCLAPPSTSFDFRTFIMVARSFKKTRRSRDSDVSAEFFPPFVVSLVDPALASLSLSGSVSVVKSWLQQRSVEEPVAMQAEMSPDDVATFPIEREDDGAAAFAEDTHDLPNKTRPRITYTAKLGHCEYANEPAQPFVASAICGSRIVRSSKPLKVTLTRFIIFIRIGSSMVEEGERN